MKAIETIYKGYRFRSRLEARYAVLLDALGLAWEYEHEGFEFDGERYLPDFYLPEADIFAEVKPVQLTTIQRDKLVRFIFQAGKGICLFIGTPDLKTPIHILFPLIDEDLLVEVKTVAPESKPQFRAAVLAARQARFEHGEQPQLPAITTKTPAFTQLPELKLVRPPVAEDGTHMCAHPFDVACGKRGVYPIGSDRYVCFMHRLKWLDTLTFQPQKLSAQERALQRLLGNL